MYFSYNFTFSKHISRKQHAQLQLVLKKDTFYNIHLYHFFLSKMYIFLFFLCMMHNFVYLHCHFVFFILDIKIPIPFIVNLFIFLVVRLKSLETSLFPTTFLITTLYDHFLIYYFRSFSNYYSRKSFHISHSR